MPENSLHYNVSTLICAHFFGHCLKNRIRTRTWDLRKNETPKKQTHLEKSDLKD